jgi:hypothetical protein
MNVYINLIVFILTSIFYFYSIKPAVTYDTIEEEPSQKGLAIYALIIILTQFGLNVSAIINKCGGSASQNIGVAALFTFLPWTLIFGIVLAILIIYPGFKSAFSDVVGYFYITGAAHILFSEMLAIKGDINSKIEGEPDSVDKPALRSTADALIKMCGNLGVLINQIVPSNFKDYWTLLSPLMKPANELANQPLYKGYIQSESKTEKQPELKGGFKQMKGGLPEPVTINPASSKSASDFYRDELLKLVVTRDNVGEAMWYFYTGILVISIIQYYILSRGCLSDAATMEKNYQKFLEKEADIQAQKDATQNTTYTVTA